MLLSKFDYNLKTHYDVGKADKIISMCSDQNLLENMKVTDFMSEFAS